MTYYYKNIDGSYQTSMRELVYEHLIPISKEEYDAVPTDDPLFEPVTKEEYDAGVAALLAAARAEEEAEAGGEKSRGASDEERIAALEKENAELREQIEKLTAKK